MSRIARPAAPRGTDMLSAGADLGRKPTPAVAAATAAEDADDDDRGGAFVHRTTSAAAAGITKPAGVPASVFEAGKMAKPPRKPPMRIDLSEVTVEPGLPVPAGRGTRHGSPYANLLAKMKPGDSVLLPYEGGKSLQGAALRLKMLVTMRRMPGGMARCWRLAPDAKPAATPGGAS